MSEGSGTAQGGPVSNPGTASNLTPAAASSAAPVTGMAASQQPVVPVPLLSIPTPSNGPTISPQATSGAGDPNNLQQPKIPPLMGIRTDTLPPPPPVQLPTALSTHTTGEVSVASDGAPKLGEPPRLQSKTQELDHDEDSDGEDGKGEGDPAALYVNQCACMNELCIANSFLYVVLFHKCMSTRNLYTWVWYSFML